MHVTIEYIWFSFINNISSQFYWFLMASWTSFRLKDMVWVWCCIYFYLLVFLNLAFYSQHSMIEFIIITSLSSLPSGSTSSSSPVFTFSSFISSSLELSECCFFLLFRLVFGGLLFSILMCFFLTLSAVCLLSPFSFSAFLFPGFFLFDEGFGPDFFFSVILLSLFSFYGAPLLFSFCLNVISTLELTSSSSWRHFIFPAMYTEICSVSKA